MSDTPQNGDGMDEIDVSIEPIQRESAERQTLQPESTQAEPSADDFAEATEAAVSEGLDEPDLSAFAEDDSMWQSFFEPDQHVTMERSPLKPTKLPAAEEALGALMVGFEEAQNILEKNDLLDLSEERAKQLSPTERRLVNITRSLSAVFQTSYFNDMTKSGDWRQSVRHNDTELTTSRLKLDRVNDPILVLRADAGQGALVQIPLWHTGIWITVRAPSNSDLLDLDQRVRMEKSTLGRYSNGMVFSNVEVYTIAAYARFALDHVYSVTYQNTSPDITDELLSVIKITDYPQLMYGLLTAMYPDGYPFRQPCIADPHKCDHIEETILSIARLSWTDRDRLTAKQKRMMASRSAKKTLEQLEEYQTEFAFDNRAVQLTKSTTAYLAVPTIADAIDAGYRWVDGIADATNKAFGLKLSEVDRYRHIIRSGVMSSLRQYSHWIDRIEIKQADGVDPTVITDPVKKDEALEVLSGSKSALKLLDESILKWIAKCTVTIIGLTKSPCPKCQAAPSEELTKHPHLIPIDIGYVFFTLVALRLKQIEGAADER